MTEILATMRKYPPTGRTYAPAEINEMLATVHGDCEFFDEGDQIEGVSSL